jgi:hypothetical protein
MVRVPWATDREDGREPDATVENEGDQVVACEFQDGTLVVFEDELHIERTPRSKFSDKRIPTDQVRDVTYAKRLVISYIQIEQVGFDTSEESLFTSPVDENTLHFGRGKRECARRASEAILERITPQ